MVRLLLLLRLEVQVSMGEERDEQEAGLACSGARRRPLRQEGPVDLGAGRDAQGVQVSPGVGLVSGEAGRALAAAALPEAEHRLMDRESL